MDGRIMNGGWVVDEWMVDGCWMGGQMVDVYMHDKYMEGRKDDLGSTVSATCNSRQSASKTQVQ